MISQLLELCWKRSCRLRYVPEVCQMRSKPEHERHMCDMINLGSLTRQFPDLSGSPLDDVEQIYSTSALDVLRSIVNLIPLSDTPVPDDHFTMVHKSCCVGRSLLVNANEIINSVDGIELEALASKTPPPQPTQALSELVERINQIHDSPQLKVVMRLTAIPNNTNFWQDVAVPSQARSDMGFAWCPKLICIHCPAFEYSLFQHRHLKKEQHTTEALTRHTRNWVHWRNVMGNFRLMGAATISGNHNTPHNTPQESPL